MDKGKRKVLDKLKNWQEENTELYNQKNELEKKILEVDLKIWHLMCEYDILCKELLK